MPLKQVMKDHESSMKKAVEFLEAEYKGVRTGRASTGLIDNLRVDYYGSPTPILQLATTSSPDATSIVIKPFDPSSAKEIEKAIKASDLGFTPHTDGGTIRLTIPPMSQERREKVATQVKQMGEHQKISIRNIRRDANKKIDDLQKSKEISEDDRDRSKKEIDEMTKKYTAQIDNDIKEKTKEVLES